MNVNKEFKKLNDIDHCLSKPGMYIGSTTPQKSEKWIIEDGVPKLKEITYNPGFLKIFDEIITNSIDESKRRGSKLNTVKITIEESTIKVWDNGGIPVVKHREHKEWIPEMVFSNFKAGSNFNDDQNREWAGTFGVGSTATNIFSKKFKVSTCDGKKSFKQEFSNNMRKRTKPTIKPGVKNHTEIEFQPDFTRFKMDKIDNAHLLMLTKRVYDIAACNKNLKVYLNDKHINFKSFQDYIKVYTSDFIYEEGKDWSIGVALSESGFKHISFVNSIETMDGGTHVDYIMNQIISKLREFFEKKYKVDVKPSELKSHIFLFLNSTVVNPAFSSQTKEKLITDSKEFGRTVELSNKFIQSIIKSEIIESILDWIDKKRDAQENKLKRDLNKKISKIKVDKLIDSKGKERWRHTLGIFEGDCIDGNTMIKIINGGEISDKRIKDVNVGDQVISHAGNICNITAKCKTRKKKSIIKTTQGDLICSVDHKWWVFDTETGESYFTRTENLDKNKHKLIRKV